MTLELTTVKSLRETVAAWRAAGETIALVPTMGALHRGHLTLVERARERATRVVVSIFVNPTQFGPNEDFDHYPRPRQKDLLMLREEGADAAWLPTVEEMYPQGFATNVTVKGISEGLDGAARPGHFDGVATVVAKLLLQAMPDVALFGEKDYQQLCVIKRLVADLNIPVRIEGVPTVREASGLALSSRNQYLSAAEHEIAPQLYMTLKDLASMLRNDQSVIPAQAGIQSMTHQHYGSDSKKMDPRLRGDDKLKGVLEQARIDLLKAGFSRIDYLELRAEDSLAPMQAYSGPARLLVAAWLGKTRLIDNVAVV
jgi:pantoate--beta-alanine ligase